MRDILKVAQAVLAELDCPRSLTVTLMMRHGEWDQLANLRVEVADYNNSDNYYRAAQATELLRKSNFLPLSTDRRKAAVDNFYVAEQQCYRTNERLYRFVFQAPCLDGPAPEAILALARKNIGSWLGKFSDLRVIELAGHGPGATYNDRGKLSTVPDKMSSNPTLTQDAWRWLVPFSLTAWARALSGDSYLKREPESVPGNRFTTVPKDSLKDRGICIEASLNVYYQLGVGRLLKSRLRFSTGLDLRYAQNDHRADAQASSAAGDRATIDLSNASDTVCKNLVRILLPSDWYSAMSTLRSPKTFIDGRWVLLEKFSSMGNGYTFELETVLFLGLAVATAQYLGFGHLATPGHDIRVYGDDIIVPLEFASEFLTVLEFAGFTPNPKKTFLSTPFRESCGGDYYDGVAVRPLSIKEDPSEPFEWMVLANRIRKSFGESLSWKRCIDHLPTVWRQTTGPEHLGDVCLHTSSGWSRREKHSIHYNRCMVPVQQYVDWDHVRPKVVLASALYGTGDGRPDGQPNHRGGFAFRGNVTGYRQGWVADS